MGAENFDFWKFLAGIGLFLWGMYQLESSIKELAGRSFRNLLQKFTDSTWKGILIGALITAVLQSSSLVTLMVLAFLGAGVLNLRNSIGVILGANLGTTSTAWVVAAIGFKLSVASISMPFLGLGSILYLFFSTRPILKNLGLFSVGFGLLFLGMDFMKTSIEAIAEQVNLGQLHQYGLFLYLIVGAVITALIQSSTAMTVITLSAMSAGLINLTEGVVLIIGANIGTTVTVSIGAINGSADKKRLALAHFLFNLITGLLVFTFVHQFIDISMKLFSIKDPVMELVLFNTLFNSIGIVIFFPFVNRFEAWLKRRFVGKEKAGLSVYVKNVSTSVPEAALSALEKDVQLAFDRTCDFITNVWDGKIREVDVTVWRRILMQPLDLMDQYQQIKTLEDELTEYHIRIQEENLNLREAQKLTSLMLTLRTMVFAAKDIKDVMHNIDDMEEEEDLLVLEYHESMRNFYLDFIAKLRKYLEKSDFSEQVPDWIGENAKQYKIWINELYHKIAEKPIEFPVSTMTNVIKQVVSSMDNLGSAVIHWKHQKKKVIDEPSKKTPEI